MTLWAVAALGVLAGAAPDRLTLPGFRLHLQLSEDIEPDRLEAVARPGVVLWLETASNLLKRSVAERVGHAEACYVQVRPPLSASLRQQFTGRVHPWVALPLDVVAYRRWAPGGTAVEYVGSLTEERLGSLQALHAQVVRWRLEAAPTPEEWARAARVAGLEVHVAEPLPPCARPLRGATRIRLRVPAAQVDTSAAGCGFALRMEVPAAISETDLQDLLVKRPGAELWVQVGTEADAVAAAALVGRLAAAVPSSQRAPAPGAH